MQGVGLVLEGGGMRGVYTAGVLDFFMEKNLFLPYVIGVSAGACQAASYIARQHGRNKVININYSKDHRYLSYRNLLVHKSMFGMDFIFDEIPNKLVPFDYETFNSSEEKFLIGTTDCLTGEAVYFQKDDCDVLLALKASSSLPFFSPMVNYKNFNLLDGGISDPIPIRKSILDGNNKNVVVLTRNQGYRKTSFKFKWMAEMIYKKHKGIIEAMVNRPSVYNNTLEYLEELEREEKVFIIRPQSELHVKRMEKNPQKLLGLYDEGYRNAESIYGNLVSWLAQ